MGAVSKQDRPDSAPSAFEAVRQMLDRGIAAVTRPGKPLGCMVSSGMLMTGPENADLAQALKAIRSSTRTALERRILRDIDHGRLPESADAGVLARFYVSVLQGFSVQALDGASAIELNSVASLALQAWPSASTANLRTD